MATIHENKLVGKEMVKQLKYRWDSKGKVLEEVETKHDGDAEAGGGTLSRNSLTICRMTLPTDPWKTRKENRIKVKEAV